MQAPKPTIPVVCEFVVGKCTEEAMKAGKNDLPAKEPSRGSSTAMPITRDWVGIGISFIETVALLGLVTWLALWTEHQE